MTTHAEATSLSELYLEDETAWLDAMSDLAARRATKELDYENLSKYLAGQVERDRREVWARLTLLLHQLLQREDPEHILPRPQRIYLMEQSDQLESLLECRSMFEHARAILPKAYAQACELAAAETASSVDQYPETCPWEIETLMDSNALWPDED